MLAINKDGSYLLQAGIMKVTAQPDEVYLIEETKQQAKKIIERSQRAFRSAGASTELDLRGMSADEAIATLDIFLDNAMMANLASVRIIHGKGTGRPAQGRAGRAEAQSLREALPPRRLRRGRGRCDHRRAGLTGNPGKLEKTVDKCPCFVIF